MNLEERQLYMSNLALEKELDLLAEEIAEQESSTQDYTKQILSKELYFLRIKSEAQEALRMRVIGESLSDAFNIIVQQGKRYLDMDSYYDVIDSFEKAFDLLMKCDDNDIQEKNFKDIMAISNTTMSQIEKIAQEKFKEGDFSSSAKLYILLTVLNPVSYNYWIRLGINYQEMKEYKEAIKVYRKAFVINPLSIPNHLFIAECFIDLNDKVEALAEIDYIKSLLDSEPESRWAEHFRLLNDVVNKL